MRPVFVSRVIAVLLCSAEVILQSAVAQVWPTRPVRIVNPTQPGGPSDIMARSMAQSQAID